MTAVPESQVIPDPRRTLVIGDITIDWLAYPVPARSSGEDPRVPCFNWQRREGTAMVARPGGAMLLAKYVKATTGHEPTSYELPRLEQLGPDQHIHSIVDLRPPPPPTDEKKNPKPPVASWVVDRTRGFYGPGGAPQPPPVKLNDPSIVVIDDAGNGFREADKVWGPAIEQAGVDWIVLKMSQPLAVGKLWETLRKWRPKSNNLTKSERLIVVVAADDLRKEGINLSRHLSWERTAEDFLRNIASLGDLATLVTCAHLIVRFDCDGVIHHRGRSTELPMLYFDPARAEGDFVDQYPGRMVGLTSAFVAGLVSALPSEPHDDGLADAICRGMQAARVVAHAGFASASDCGPDYPFDALAQALRKPDESIKPVPIPSQEISSSVGDAWSILEHANGPAVGEVALRVAELGLSKLGRAPIASFGKLQTADRQEIESFRSVSNLLRDYAGNRGLTKPISIAVFGPPGAGKSYGLEEVATAIAGKNLTTLKFNLSQFTGPDDLVAAFHRVRDEGLAGKLPLVFLDEFDVEFNGPLGWLRFLLAPMQDGEFTEDGVTHPVGRAIFTFAGGTRASFRKFSEPLLFEEKHPDRISFVAAKGPDFVSRLRGHVDILGPDPSSPDDRMYPIRRAILLRSLILKHAPQLFREEANVPPTEQPLRIDPGVLRALLQTRAYRHGARSMEAVLLMSRLTGRQEFERAALPPQGQLEMHVDAKAFLTQVDAERLSDKMRDQLAPLLHERYRQRQLWRARRKPDPALANDPSMRPWETLPEHMKESNRLQADDIPRKLRLIDCYMAPEDPGRAVFDIRPFWRKLAREEHDRWLAERLQRHWREGRRNALDRTTPFLRPWQDLDILTRGNDLNAVASIPFVLGCIGYRIYRLDQP